MQKLISTLVKINKLTHDTCSYEFEVEPESLLIKPGQFVSLVFTSPDGKQKFNRAYSVAGFGPDAKIESGVIKTRHIRLIIKSIPNGKASEVLENIQIGTKMPLMGASGLLTPPLDSINTPLLLCGSSTGIVPFLSYLEYYSLSKSYPKVDLYFGVRHIDDIYLIDELEKFVPLWRSNGSSFNLKICVSQEDDSALKSHQYSPYLNSGRMTEHIPNDISDENTARNAYLCGGKAFVLGMKEFLTNSMPECKVFYESFF